MMQPRKIHAIAVAVILGIILELIAVTSSFKFWQFLRSGLDSNMLIIYTLLGGVFVICIGYASVIFFGGRTSLGIAEFISRMGRSRQVIEKADEKENMLFVFLFYVLVPVAVFFFLVAIGWNIFNLDSSKAGFFQPILHAIDVFARAPRSVSPASYSAELIPISILLAFLAGIVPSICAPYFRRFRVIGINTRPFHIALLLTIGGLLVGLGLIFTLLGEFYQVLWIDRAPVSYHYVLLTMLGFSLHYAAGIFLGLGKAEKSVSDELRKKKGGPVTGGRVTVKLSGRS